jgi:hypothetical protein
MNRRNTLTAMLAFGAVAGLPAVRAQSPKPRGMPVLGVLSSFPIVSPEEWANSPFWSPLRKLGWVEGQNFQVERASSYPNDDDRLPALAEELARKRVDVIFAASNESAVGCHKENPNRVLGSQLPCRVGACRLTRPPGGNVTGIALYVGPAEFTKT